MPETVPPLSNRELEAPDEGVELLRGAGQRLGRRGDLLRGGAGLLRGGRHLLGGGAGLLGDRGDLADVTLGATRLGGDLVHGAGDLADAARDVLDGGADRLERLTGLLDGRDAVGRAAAALGDDLDDVLRLGLDLTDQSAYSSWGWRR